MDSFLSGVFLGLSLIVAIGAQNIWVLSQSMSGANRFAVALPCIVSDGSLIVIGVMAASEVKEVMPSITPWLIGGGVLMLLYLAAMAAIRAYRGNSGLHAASARIFDWKTTVAQAFAISLLNPHVYLDTVVLLGSIGAVQLSPAFFALGAFCCSILWFAALTALGPRLRVLLKSPLRWRIFDGSIAGILVVIAYQLTQLI